MAYPTSMQQQPISDTLRETHEHARSVKVHEKQCILLSSLLENALTASGAQGDREAGQQWDDALNDVHAHLVEWGKLDVVQSFLYSDQIRKGIDKLYGDLLLCGVKSEDVALQFNEKRRQDDDALQNTLRQIGSSQELLENAMNQPPDRIRFLIKRLQSTLREDVNASDVRPKLEHALKSLYKRPNVRIHTPDLTTQICDISPMPSVSNLLCQAYQGNWLGDESVTVKALRRVRYDPVSIKRFCKDVTTYQSAKHPNIVPVYGMLLGDALGCCLVTPPTMDINALSYLECHGDTYVVRWLKEVAAGLQYLHGWDPPFVYGCLRAENIIITDDGQGVRISDFGLFQLSSNPSRSVDDHLRWCAPELIRAARKKERDEDIKLACTTQADVYSLGIVTFGCMHVYKLFTSEPPFYHIEGKETLEPEILHGTRPNMAKDMKARASRRGWSIDVHNLMKKCWEGDPRKRPDMDTVLSEISAFMVRSNVPSPNMEDRPESGSSGSLFSSASSRQDSLVLPQTPQSFHSTNADDSTLVNHHEYLTDGNYFPNQLFAEPAQITLDNAHLDRHNSSEMVRQMSAMSVRSEQDHSTRTVTGRSGLRSSFDNDSEDGHLGQGNDAFDRMPKLKPPSLMSTRRKGSRDRFEILVGRMTIDGRINERWAGVAHMEGLRGITQRTRKLTQISAVESLVEKETRFLADSIDDVLAERLRAEPSILGITRLERFISTVFEDSRTLRLVNQHFRNALLACSDVGNIGFSRMASVCKEAAEQFCLVYPEYIHRLPDVQACVSGEIESNPRFAVIMKERLRSGITLHNALSNFLSAPVAHLEQHPRTLQLIVTEMDDGDPEAPVLQEAMREMQKAVKLGHLSSWQLSSENKGWKDFVTSDIIKGASKLSVNRQLAVFELITEERDYVRKLSTLQHVVKVSQRELINMRSQEDTILQEILKSVIAVFGELLRFHQQLLENLFTLQRADHPFIGTFVSTCGIDQVPWHSLYDHRFGTSYRKLADLMQDGKIRSGVFKRVLQGELNNRDSDFMSLLRTPSLHLRAFVGYLRTILKLTPEDKEDFQVISDIFPRLWDVCQQVEVKTSMSRERARLSSLAAALDLSSHPSIASDIDISSDSRSLIISGTMKVGVIDRQQGKVSLEERYVVLLDNYLILTTKADDNQGIFRLIILERPIPLDLVTITFDDVLPITSPVPLFPCATVHYYNAQETMYLYAEDKIIGKDWQAKLWGAVTARSTENEKSRAISLEVVHSFVKPPSSSTEFYYDGQAALVASFETSEAGIWLRQGRDTPLRHVVSLEGIKSLSFVKELGILVVLAEKTLRCFRIDDLMKSNRPSPRSLDDGMDVHFYRIGVVADRTFLVVSAHRKGKNVLRFYGAPGHGKSPKKPNVFRGKSVPFNLVTEAEVSYHVKDICFLKSSFILVADTFRLANFVKPPQSKNNSPSLSIHQVLPLPDDPLTDLVDRCRSSTPVAIHRFDKEFVLCYQDFAAYINENGRLSSRFVEWESRDVQNIVFRHPYMIVLGSSTVEVRLINSGKIKELLPAPGRMQLSWEAHQNEINADSLGLHLIMGKGAEGGVSNQWYSLDEHLPYTLFRVCLR